MKCRQENSVLVDVTNDEENVYIQHRHNGKRSWLGLNDVSTEGNFTWADRGEGNFTAWAKNQPNNLNEEDCVHALGLRHNYEWNDVKCSDCHQYTCKKGRMVAILSTVCISICVRRFSGTCYQLQLAFAKRKSIILAYTVWCNWKTINKNIFATYYKAYLLFDNKMSVSLHIQTL